jgi:hypothetical protein
MSRRETAETHRHGRTVIPAKAVRAALAPVAAARIEPATAGPNIEVVREDGVVRAIDVTCACGERLRIVCEYEK